MPYHKDSEHPPVIVLTGGIGSGKSTVAGMLANLGAFVIDADKVAHNVYRPGSEGFALVVGHFGQEVLAADGSIDRRKLGDLVFSNEKARQRLNSIVHPRVAQEIANLIASRLKKGLRDPIVLEIPLLVETRGMWQGSEIWLVRADKEIILERLAGRGMNKPATRARMASQATDEERLKHADVVINNNGTIDELRKKVVAEWHRLLADSV